MKILNCIFALIFTRLTMAKAPIEVIFFIRSQDAPPQNQLSKQLKENLVRQSLELQPDYNIKVQILHELFNYPGEWTILHVIPYLMACTPATEATKQIDDIGLELITKHTRWIVFCEDTTSVDVRLLMQGLNAENHTQPLFLGHPLHDREPTIIHHFAFFENPKWFPYPMLRAGIVFSMPLLRSIANIFSSSRNKHLEQPLLRSEFSIDAAHELARFIYDNVQIPMATATATATTATAQTTMSSLNDGKSPHVNVYHRTSRATTKADTKSDAALHTYTNTDTGTDTRTNRRPLRNVNVDASDLSHSDFRHTNEIIDFGSKKAASAAKGQKIILKKASYICPEATWETGNEKNNKVCAMYAIRTAATTPSTAAAAAAEVAATSTSSAVSCIPTERDRIYFAVKTCSRYHKERLPVIQSTWAPYAKHIKYFSDVEDNDIPTINTGVANVEMGHCAKTLQILRLALRDIENYNSVVNTNSKSNSHVKDNYNNRLHRSNLPHPNKDNQIQWLFLTDDDTLLSVSGVCQVLGCYNSVDEIYLGERYGYRLYAPDGFNYITGGGGIAFSLPVVKLIVQHCSCPLPSSPDDMILGSCLHTLQLKALHSSRFHQARPDDYSTQRLRQEAPISFHKFWQLDPIEVYRQWFLNSDDQLLLMNAKEIAAGNDRRNPPKEKHIHYYHKNHNLLTKTKAKIDFNEFVPVSLIATLHHSKERHVDL